VGRKFTEVTGKEDDRGRFDARRGIVVESATAIKCLTEKTL
jgi:hypothetical protein